MFWSLISLAVLLCLIGLVNLSGATVGVGLICIACFLGILARLVQVSKNRGDDRARAWEEKQQKNAPQT